jgi:hypothetical protein
MYTRQHSVSSSAILILLSQGQSQLFQVDCRDHRVRPFRQLYMTLGLGTDSLERGNRREERGEAVRGLGEWLSHTGSVCRSRDWFRDPSGRSVRSWR